MALRTTRPMVTGGSVVALKYKDGCVVATDTIASYGSLARYENITRVAKVTDDALLAAGGDFSDYQQLLKLIEQKDTADYVLDDKHSLSPSALHAWITRLMYQRRSKMDPLWNSLVILGFRDGEPYLGATNLYGTAFQDDFTASGLGAHLALPLLRKQWRADMDESEARALLCECMKVLFYRDTRASAKVTVAKVDATGCTVDEPLLLDTKWDYEAFARGNKAGDGSW